MLVKSDNFNYTFNMSRKLPLLIILFILFSAFTVYAQEETEGDGSESLIKRPDFWIGFGADTAFYNASGLTYGAHLMMGYGSGSSIGLKTAFFFNEMGYKLLELNLLLRFYFLGKDAYLGSFFQFIGGASLINYDGVYTIPSNTGIFNAGVGLGWRFLYADHFFIEPVFRIGYPYFMGMDVSVGFRF